MNFPVDMHLPGILLFGMMLQQTSLVVYSSILKPDFFSLELGMPGMFFSSFQR
jgi:hypothetical protein